MAKHLRKMDKQEVWQHIIKPIMVVSMWLLAVGALVAIICGGVRSCSNKQVAARENDTAENVGQTTTPLKMKRDVVNDNEYLVMRSNTLDTISLSDLQTINGFYDVPNQYVGIHSYEEYKTYNLNGVQMLLNGQWEDVVSVVSYFKDSWMDGTQSGGVSTNNIYLYWVALVLGNGNNYNIMEINESTDPTYKTYDIIHGSGSISWHILKGNKSQTGFNWAFDYLYSQTSGQGFVFNSQINYNAPLNSSLGQPYVSYAGTGVVQIYYDFDFISGGQVFNRIEVDYIRGGGTYDIEGTPTYVSDPSIVHYGSITYHNTLTGVSVGANSRNSKPYTTSNNGTSMYLLNSSYWVSSVYQNIEIVGNISNNTLIDLTKFNNNTIPLDNGITGNTSNVFDLLGSAFGSVASILAMSVLPGISLGLLVFIPVVMVIIMALFKLLRK